jgi:hypothetical protein
MPGRSATRGFERNGGPVVCAIYPSRVKTPEKKTKSPPVKNITGGLDSRMFAAVYRLGDRIS